MELAQTRRVWLSGRESGYLKRRFLGRDLYKWIWPAFTRFSADTRIGRRLKVRSLQSDPLIGITPSQLAASGLTRVGRFTEVRDGLPYCRTTTIDPEIVIWCTGFDPDYSWIQLPVLGVDGYPLHERGVVANAPGLYFLGLRFQHRKTSSLIGGVGADAEFITNLICTS
jgi:putative flavoprotein involved in K+ transport